MQAYTHFEQAGIEDRMAQSLVYLALCYLELGQSESSKSSLDSATGLDAYQETRWQYFFALGQYHEGMAEITEAIEAYYSAIGVIEEIRGNFTIEEFKSLYLEDKIEVYDRLINLLMGAQRVAEALDVSEKARARAFLKRLHGSHQVAPM